MIWPLLLISAWALPQFLNGDGNQVVYPPSTFEQVPMAPDGQFLPFWFGEAGNWAFQTFTMRATSNFLIYVVDCFCPGDAFALYNNGELIGQVNNFCFPNDDACSYYRRTANECFSTPQTYCRQQFSLNPGIYNFTLYVTASPYSYGQAFIRASLP